MRRFHVLAEDFGISHGGGRAGEHRPADGGQSVVVHRFDRSAVRPVSRLARPNFQ